MNELIEKLAEQAMVKAVAKNFTGDKLELRMPSEAWAKEFVELIVRECANVAHNKQYKHSPAHTTGDCATAIKQHFGVE